MTIMKKRITPRSDGVRKWWLAIFRLAIAIVPTLATFAGPNKEVPLGTVHSIAQQEIVSGVVTDESGVTLSGVSVRVKNEHVGGTTDDAGRYQIAVAGGSAVLVFSYLGYLPQEVHVDGRTSIDVRLAATETSLDAVVVVGYGTQKRARVTTAMASDRPDNYV